MFVFQNEYLKCEIDEENSILIHRWLRQPSSEEFKEGLGIVLDEYQINKSKYQGLKWLADTELLGELNEADENWLTTKWDRMLFEDAGVKIHAVILGSDIFADYPMELFKKSSIHKFNERGVKLGVFPDMNRAFEWLKNQ